MKKKILILLAIVLAASTPLAPQASAIDFSISLGDRPYYYGPNYWNEGYYWVWVPGHRRHGRWVHGHYERRGGWDSTHARIRFRNHLRWDRDWDRRDWDRRDWRNEWYGR
jgi:hypothetical protein